MRVRIKNILIGVVLGLISLSTYTHGQSTSTPAQETVKWAQGKTEAVFLDGPIVLRIISQENGASEVRWQMRDNKETLLFKVGVRDGKKGSAGLMYVTAGGVEYFPDDAKQDKLAFRREKTSIKMVKLESKGRIFAPTSYVDFKATDGFDCKIFGLFEKEYEDNKGYASELNKLIADSISDFDVALERFHGLTASAFHSTERDLYEKTGIISSYDKFEDVTTTAHEVVISKPANSRFQELGPFLSLILSYRFAGKKQADAPNVFSLSFRYRVFVCSKCVHKGVFNVVTPLNILADGQRLHANMSRNIYETDAGYAVETVTASFPSDQIALVFNSRSIEFRVGDVELSLTPQQIETIRKYIRWGAEQR